MKEPLNAVLSDTPFTSKLAMWMLLLADPGCVSCRETHDLIGNTNLRVAKLHLKSGDCNVCGKAEHAENTRLTFSAPLLASLFLHLERERLPKVSNQKELHFWHYQVIILCLALLQTYFWLADTFVFDFGPCLIVWAGYLIHEAPSKLFSRTSSIKMGAVEPIPVQPWSQNAWQIRVTIMRGWCLWLPSI